MTHTVGYYDHVEHDAVTAMSLIRQQRKLLEMQMQHINDLNARLAEQIRLRSETVELLVRANERIEELEADLGINRQPVPYALEPRREDYRPEEPRASSAQAGRCGGVFATEERAADRAEGAVCA